MSLPAIILLTTVYCATTWALTAIRTNEAESEKAIGRNDRDINDDKMTALTVYWKAYAQRRTEALIRCETRLFRYSNRRKQAQELLINVARRYTKTEVADVKLTQQDTEITEATLKECVQQIIALQGEDAFYREYQHLSEDLQRLTDQVTSCLHAGGQITSTNRRSTGSFDEQAMARLSPQMLRVYDNIQRLRSAKEAEKQSCFRSLEIPASFPVQLEVVVPGQSS